MRRPLRRTRRPLIALLALVVALIVGYAVNASTSHDSSHGPTPTASSSTGSPDPTRSDEVALSSLPRQVAATVRLIRAGGPFPYPRNDGAVFHNYEHVLPREPDGWYHEYTVPTPGSDDRGARRLVTGRSGEYFYTDDHYDTFKRVDVNR
ncbi:ribonuclease domain-containing protein [uncultured Jatrophihabitans sp.]|uniref:ribonuclease domain-containing protein n=1 Tax=uncultured Jatrophihabitans sp. TaxID=1610747 RepID=UPI0035CA7BC9